MKLFSICIKQSPIRGFSASNPVGCLILSWPSEATINLTVQCPSGIGQSKGGIAGVSGRTGGTAVRGVLRRGVTGRLQSTP